MSKEYEKIRTELSKKYKTRITELESENLLLRDSVSQLKVQNSELQNQLESMKEWVERMQDFCNMSEEDLKRSIENEKALEQAKSSLKVLAVGLGKSSIFNGVW